MKNLTILIPCLNEEETIGRCISKAIKNLKKHKIKGEVLVVDNGSTDKSIEISKKHGARVIIETKFKGYGYALRKGIKQSKGKFIIMGDADDSYDFNIINKFYNKLLEGYDIVQGCRFPSGGGVIKKNAMPFSHKFIGNPFFTFLLKILFGSPFNDVYCGMRGFRRSISLKHNYICKGMQFAIEHLIKFLLTAQKITEIPITLHRDGRKKHSGHLKTYSDGFKTLKLLLLFSPTWIYIFFETILIITFYSEIKNYFISSNYSVIKFLDQNFLFSILSFQIFFLWIFSKQISLNLGFSKNNAYIELFFKIFKIEYLMIFLLILLFNIFLFELVQFEKNFYILMSIVVFNSLLISLTEIIKNKKF
tara:strand:+ start:1032 stop:2120 length:1089 start_codon:yes stop_codon:yes gene_type:complete